MHISDSSVLSKEDSIQMTSFSPARENNKSKLIGNNLDYVKRNYNVFKFKSLKTKPKTKQV